MAERRKQVKEEKIEPVLIVDKRSGTICTVGSNVVEKYTGGKNARYRDYDESIDAVGDDDDEFDDDKPEPEQTPTPEQTPAKK